MILRYLSVLLVIMFYNCGSSFDNGDLVGVESGNWEEERPYGMSLIPGGSFTMGEVDYDILQSKVAPPKTVSVAPFYIDETEITNGEYKQFVNWVRDSVVRVILANKVEEMVITADSDDEMAQFAYVNLLQEGEESPYNTFMIDNYGDINPASKNKGKILNWESDIIWDTQLYPSVEYAEAMSVLYLPFEEWINGERQMDVNNIVYYYQDYDIYQIINDTVSRKDKFRNNEIKVYPDTTVWLKDFTNSYNEPMHDQYFSHKSYIDYPVVGVSYTQSKAFCDWRTKYKNNYMKANGKSLVSKFRLPTEAEWEYAARGGIDYAIYPWGGPYLRDERGCFLANFKPMRGDYLDDGALYTVKSDEYYPNGYNLYNMSGNVSEWTSSSYNPISYEFMSSINPNYDKENNDKKVIRGGSWKDVGYYLKVSSRDYEYKDSARSYIGFRTVQNYQGTYSNFELDF